MAKVRLQGAVLRLLARLTMWRAEQIALQAAVGAGIDVLHIEPSVNEGVSARAEPERTRIAPLIRPAVAARVRLFGDTALWLGFAGDIDLIGVRYVVTGSARSSLDRVRVTVQLVEAETGNQLWAGRYEVERRDTLDLQDEIARRIVVELEPALTKADLSVINRRRIDSVDAWSHFRHATGAVAMHTSSNRTVLCHDM